MCSRSLPTRDETIVVIDKLIAGELTRKGASAWAFTFLSDDEISVNDEGVWAALENLGAADLVSTDRPFLYEVPDFRAWRADLVE